VAEREIKFVYIALIRTGSPKFTTRLRHRRKLYKRPHGHSPPYSREVLIQIWARVWANTFDGRLGSVAEQVRILTAKDTISAGNLDLLRTEGYSEAAEDRCSGQSVFHSGWSNR
jgi:hypothetical protein